MSDTTHTPKKTVDMEAIVSLCKRRGFIFPGSEIYGGLAGTWDYGPYGVALRNNIKNMWWSFFVDGRTDMYGVDAAILMNQNVWKSSGHVGGFNDPLVEDVKTKKRYRADHLLEDAGIDPKGMTVAEMDSVIKERKLQSPDKNPLGDVRQFNMMFATKTGAADDDSATVYLRPETAQGMFVNFKNILDTFHPRLPFGMAQIGKAFRNEIAPGNFIFRLRELEQMEIEYFVKPDEWRKSFDELLALQKEFLISLGLPESKIHQVEIPEADRAHYSKWSVDTEFDFPIGQKELLGIAYRTDFDLNAHKVGSGTDLSFFDEETKERYVPHCVEPTFGLDRLMLAVLSSVYDEEEVEGENRVVLHFNPRVAPVQVAVLPLSKKEELTGPAKEILKTLRQVGRVAYDETQSIGKRYRRQDEIGTPYCVTVDFDTLTDNAVTVRDRDTMKQERVAISELTAYIASKLEA
jgi:glycyl-tRNA synthetase